MLYLAADSGMRPQEYIAAARATCGQGRIRSIARLSASVKISVTKTPAGHRFIDLSPDTVATWSSITSRHHAPASKYDLLFPDRERPLGRSEELDAARLLCRVHKAGLLEEIRGGRRDRRIGRNTCPTIYATSSRRCSLSERVNLKRIQYLMGHEDIRTTLNVYGHLIERAEAEEKKPHAGFLPRWLRNDVASLWRVAV